MVVGRFRVVNGLLSFKAAQWAASIKNLSVSEQEHVVHSPYPPITLPKAQLHEYVWLKHHKWQDKVALECAVTGRNFTYRQGRQRSRAIAAALQNVFRLEKGECFGIVSQNTPEYPLISLAASEAGVVFTTMNPMYTADEIAKQLKDASVKVVLTTAAKCATVKEAINKLGKDIPIVIIQDDSDTPTPKGTIHLDEILSGSSHDTVTAQTWDEDDDVLLLYSSGTTGPPKGVQLCHRTLVANLAQNLAPGGRIYRDATDSYQESVLVQLPMYHAFSHCLIIFVSLCCGSKLVTVPKFEPQLLLQTIQKYKITSMSLVPPILNFIGSHPDATPDKLASVQRIVVGAAPIGHQNVLKAKEKMPNAKITQGYGLTETSPLTHLNTPEFEHKYGSCGFLLSNTSAKIVDVTTGKSLPPNQAGELHIKGPQVMKGYLNKPEATKEVITEDQWLKTGDIMYYDEDGSFYVVDRLKELIKVKGLQVAPAELEEILRTHPSVIDVAVIGIPDERAGELPKAFVVVKPGETLTAKQVQDFLAPQVAEFKHLKGGVDFIENIPRNPSGKILRRQLREIHRNSRYQTIVFVPRSLT